MILYHYGNLDKLTNSKTICEVHFFICRFGLFEAMSAIEMMDPKMDAGMIGNQVNRKVLNFEQAIKVVSIVLFVFSFIICYLYYNILINNGNQT